MSAGARIAAILADAARELRGSEATAVRDEVTWSVGGRPFAALSAATLEVRLDEVVAAAARRTPDTSGSARGPEWVTFSPASLDRYAEDRLRAWFGAAHRRAAG